MRMVKMTNSLACLDLTLRGWGLLKETYMGLYATWKGVHGMEFITFPRWNEFIAVSWHWQACMDG